MYFNTLRAALPLGVLLLAGCASTPRTAGTEPTAFPGYQYLTSPEAREQAQDRLTTFAADDMEGRETASPGERKATDFLADHFRQLGVLPAGDVNADGSRSYFQTFDINTVGLDREATYLRDPSGRHGTFRYGTDLVSFPQYLPTLTRADLPVAFVGYGLPSDYAGKDVRGKMVVMMGGAPAGAGSGAWADKLVPAIQAGAAAFIVIDDPFFLDSWYGVYPATVQPGMALASDGPMQSLPLPFFFTSTEAAPRLIAALGLPASTREEAAQGRPLAYAESDLRLDLHVKTQPERRTARNVVGYLPGATKPEEYVAFGAHLDGHGTVDGVVYNGADDDGTGTIGVLGVAEAFVRDRRAGQMTDRSLLFVLHTGEEKGLLGSDFFTANAERSVLDSVRQIVAQINLDMIGREAPDSLYMVGASRLSTEFGRRVDAVNRALGANGQPLIHLNEYFDRPDDPENIYERSDHFNYARFGVPIVFFFDGMGANWQKNQPADDYHEPSDDIELIDFNKMLTTMRLVYGIGRVTADAPNPPPVDRPIPAPTGTHD